MNCDSQFVRIGNSNKISLSQQSPIEFLNDERTIEFFPWIQLKIISSLCETKY